MQTVKKIFQQSHMYAVLMQGIKTIFSCQMPTCLGFSKVHSILAEFSYNAALFRQICTENKKKHNLCSITLSVNRAVNEIMWKNMAEP